jgi:serine phosphatase RsbU (regulator of sigma subunit)
MYRLVSEEGFFATIALARYWPSNGKMHLALGGHLSPLWIVEGDIRNLPQIEGISLGVTTDARYGIDEILLSPGESILFFTDGVIEAENENNELFGNERLVTYLKNAKGPPWGKGLLNFISDWRGNSSANDDLTILEIWRDYN